MGVFASWIIIRKLRHSRTVHSFSLSNLRSSRMFVSAYAWSRVTKCKRFLHFHFQFEQSGLSALTEHFEIQQHRIKCRLLFRHITVCKLYRVEPGLRTRHSVRYKHSYRVAYTTSIRRHNWLLTFIIKILLNELEMSKQELSTWAHVAVDWR